MSKEKIFETEIPRKDTFMSENSSVRHFSPNPKEKERLEKVG